jgi:Protein of unknown function (DUF4241)
MGRRQILLTRWITSGSPFQLLMWLLTCLALPSAAAADPLAPPSYVKAFDLAFTSGFTWPGDDKMPVPFAVIDGGTLNISSGVIKAADPFLLSEDAGFTQKVPSGQFPVRFAHAAVHGKAGGRIVFARVDFSSRAVVRWQMATTAAQDPKTLKPDYIFGYPVDAGTGSFMDQSAARAFLDRFKDSDATQAVTDRWITDGETSGKAKGLNFYLNVDMPPGNFIMFESGWGDGYYASYFGFAADGSVVCLLTDFQVMDWSLESLP